jgi:chorismate mutase
LYQNKEVSTATQSDLNVALRKGILSPILFNIVADAVVRQLHTIVPEKSVWGLFYAKDGWLSSPSPGLLQTALNNITELFLRVSLHMNAKKTKTMISHPGVEVHAIYPLQHLTAEGIK